MLSIHLLLPFDNALILFNIIKLLIFVVINYIPITTAMFEKVIVIDARGHLLGRLASYVAKQLLSGTFSLI